MPSFAQQGAGQSGKPTQGAGISSKARDVEPVTTVKDRRAQGVLKMFFFFSPLQFNLHHSKHVLALLCQ